MVFAYSNKEYLSIVEQNLYNNTYPNETITNRLTRLEKSIYGKNHTGDTTYRLNYLRKSLGVPQITQQVNTTSYKSTTVNYSNYPAVSQIEQSLYNKSFENEDIYIRLNRLEQSVFNQISNKPLSDRVAALRMRITGQSNNYYDQSEYNPIHGMTLTDEITRLEMNLLNTTYSHEPIENRLARLETRLFNQPSPELTKNKRIARLMSVANAQSSSALINDQKQLRKYSDIQKGLGLGAIVIMIITSFL